ncbi:MAG: tetratricopeptide repeat protein [Gammaproteobacteria bacterium]|nr:tetratricopeptide repeat protein [Gammaproteobacteria bacterium]
MAAPSVPSAALNKAIANHQAGRLAEAAALYRQILAAAPDHPDANHLLGVIAAQRHRNAEAVTLFTRAIAARPGNHLYHDNLGNVLLSLGRLDEAITAFRRAIDLQPEYAEAHNNLGTALFEKGSLNEAVASYRRALAQQPRYLAAENNLGVALFELGMLDDAIASYRRVLAQEPREPSAYNNLGNALYRQGLVGEATAAYAEAIRYQPNYAEAHNNLGVALAEQGLLDAAIASYRRALAQQPDYPAAYNNLGIALFEQGTLDEAIITYRRALAQQPQYPAAYNNLGNALCQQGRMSEANAAYAEAIRLKPDYAEANFNLGIVLLEQGRFDRARVAFARALGSRPGYAEAKNLEWVVNRQLCVWDGFDRRLSELRAQIDGVSHSTIDPFFCLSLPLTPAEQHRCATSQADAKLAPVFKQRNRLGFSFAPGPRRVLRIGYLSADFRQHATSCLLAQVLEKHERSRFHIAAYSCGPDDRSLLRDRVVSACDQFVDIRELSHDAAARRIYRDKVDILVDLMGYTRYARPQIMALKPAPVQVSYLGYPGTSGAEWIDYLIADPIVIPRALGDCYSERVVVLPDCYQPNDRSRPIGSTPDRRACALPESAFVFCDPNQTYKITPAMFDVWMRLLKAVSGSVLWVLESNPWAADNLRREAAARGVDGRRLILAPKLPLEAHLGRLRNADLCLDTFPYTSHTTGSDALWAGVPLVTLCGKTFASRVAASLLCTLGVPELVTDSIDAYFGLASSLALTPNKLATIRSKIEANRWTSPLFDSDRYTRNIESAYEAMWNDYQHGGTAKFLSITP